jgi:hypothetical protein
VKPLSATQEYSAELELLIKELSLTPGVGWRAKVKFRLFSPLQATNNELSAAEPKVGYLDEILRSQLDG